MLIIGLVANCSNTRHAFSFSGQFQSNCILYRDTIWLFMPQQVSIKHHFLFSVKGRQKVQSLSIEDWLVVEEMEAADVFSMAGKTKKYNHCHQWNVGQIYSKDEETRKCRHGCSDKFKLWSTHTKSLINMIAIERETHASLHDCLHEAHIKSISTVIMNLQSGKWCCCFNGAICKNCPPTIRCSISTEWLQAG